MEDRILCSCFYKLGGPVCGCPYNESPFIWGLCTSGPRIFGNSHVVTTKEQDNIPDHIKGQLVGLRSTAAADMHATQPKIPTPKELCSSSVCTCIDIRRNIYIYIYISFLF